MFIICTYCTLYSIVASAVGKNYIWGVQHNIIHYPPFVVYSIMQKIPLFSFSKSVSVLR